MRKVAAAQIQHAMRQLTRRMRAERCRVELGIAAMGILGTLHRLGPMPAVRLAEVERLQPQSLTRLIASLLHTKLISRTVDRFDRRVLLLDITQTGRRALAADLQERSRWLERALKGALTESERGTLLTAADLMTRLATWPSPKE